MAAKKRSTGRDTVPARIAPLDRVAVLAEQLRYLSDILAERLNNLLGNNDEVTLINVINEKAKELDAVTREVER